MDLKHGTDGEHYKPKLLDRIIIEKNQEYLRSKNYNLSLISHFARLTRLDKISCDYTTKNIF